jgi:transcriptional regulator with XRE-family HTH domain
MQTDVIKLREHRKAKGLSVHKLAKLSNTPASTISNIENRRGKRINDPTLEKLSAALGVVPGGLAYPREPTTL